MVAFTEAIHPSIVETLSRPKIEFKVGTDFEPLAQKVEITAIKTPNRFNLSVFEQLQTPPEIAYNRKKKEEIERFAAPFYQGYSHFLSNGTESYHGITRSLGAGQISMTEDGRFIVIAKSPDYDPDAIIGFDLIAGASLQTGNINLENTAAREGSVEELIEIREENIVVPKGKKAHTVETGRKNIRNFLEIYPYQLPEPFDSTFNRILESHNGAQFIEEPYEVHPSMENALQNIPKANATIVRDGQKIHQSSGYVVMHEKGGDILYPRIVRSKFIIDTEIVINPDGTPMLLNRKFLLPTPEQLVALSGGEEVEVSMTHLGQEWKQKIQVDPKPLVKGFAQLLSNRTH